MGKYIQKMKKTNQSGMQGQLILLSIIIVIVLNMHLSSSAQPLPFVTTSSNTLQIEAPAIDTIPLGIDHRFHAHVINNTGMKTNKTTNCIFHFYNSTGFDTNIGSTDMEFESYNGVDFAITISNTNFSKIGYYAYVIQCNSTNEIGFFASQIHVTQNGNPTPTDFVTALFIVIFIIFVGLTCFVILYTLGHFLSLDFDLIDLSLDWGVFFGFMALFMFERQYFGNAMIETYFNWFLSIGGLLLLVVPLIAFLISVTVGTLAKHKMQNTNAPRRIKFGRFK